MRLSAIEATRYGAFEGACLDGLGDGLTVVLGPNEAGKSTLTALTRHVLYGYPDARTKEYGYVSSAGPRVAKLVFAEDGGEWVIERVDGKNRGPVTVSARHGAERPGLRDDLVSGVTEQSYKVVFGFGLDELAAIEHGDATEIVSRLYAAGTGLSVNPMDVRNQIEARAAAIWSPRAQKPVVNTYAADIRACKERLRDLESAAANYAADQSRLAQLAAELLPLKENAVELETLGRILDRDAARLADAAALHDELRATATDLAADIADTERAVGMIDVDERVVAVAPQLLAVLEESSAFRERLRTIDEQEAAAAEARRRAIADGALPAGAVDSVASRSEVERRRDELAQLRTDATSATRAAEAATARLDAVEKHAAEFAPANTPTAARSTTPVVLAAVVIVAGVLFAVAGVLMGQFLAAGLGGVLVIAGIVALVTALTRKPVSAATTAPLSEDVARAKAERDAAERLATEAATRLTTAQASWTAWLAQQELDAFGDDPVAVRQLLDGLAERQRLYAEADRFTAEAARSRDAAEQWVVRLVEITSRFDGSAGQIPALSAASELATRARLALDRARSGEAERAEFVRKLEAARVELRKTTERLDAATGVATEIVDRHGLDASDPLPALQSLAAAHADELAELRSEVERFAKEHDGLQAILGTEGRDRQMALDRQELEGLKAQAEQAADRYVVDALAVRLLNRARERFESERQPEVVRTAGRVFSAMTGGRYTDVRVPLDGTGITVLTSSGGIKTSDQLSRGTAEQLYLALRVGLIGSLGTTGASLPVLMDDVVVNFDPERRAGAVRAIGELASMRQVLFFTCHPETAAALTAGVAGSKVLQMDRCSL